MKNNALRALVIITGMSGSGKHTVFKAFEDLGYFCVDNLPTGLISRLVQMAKASGGSIERLAVVVDVRFRENITGLKKLFHDLKQWPFKSTIIFVDASDEVLARRYSETRRVHPLAQGKSLLEGVRVERDALAVVREMADLVMDTSDFSVHDLRNFIYKNFRETDQAADLHVSVVSFGFKHGLPYNSDLVFDVRFLPNPNFEEGLKERTGDDPQVVEFMSRYQETAETLRRLTDLFDFLLPRYRQEGKKYLTVAIGCTGGKHRSVMIANELATSLAGKQYTVNVIHRDLHRE